MVRNQETGEGLSPAERAALQSLRVPSDDYPGDEERIVRELRRRMLLTDTGRTTGRWILQVAAGVLILAGTFYSGMQYGSRPSGAIAPEVRPVADDASSGLMVADAPQVDDPSILANYRDEPDRPGDGGTLFAKMVDR